MNATHIACCLPAGCVRTQRVLQVMTTGPHMIREHPWFKRLPKPFDDNIDAAVNKPGKPNEIFLFSEDMWLLWDKQIDRAAR